MKFPGSPGTRVHDWLRGTPWGLVLLALFVGLGAGIGAIVFRWLILWFTVLFTGTTDYSADGRTSHPWFPFLGPWFLLLVPVVGGLLYGPLIALFAKEARGHGVPEVMLAVSERGGRIRSRVAVVKALASALCIGAGGSVGREGPIVQIGSAIGSSLGQILRVPDARLRLLVACGAAGGISATFNAPIAGVMFGLELILRDFETESFGVVVISSVAADAMGRAAFGSGAFLSLPPFELVSAGELVLYAILGLLAAFAGVAFTRVLYGVEDLFDRLWRWPEWLRPAAGGLLLGALLLLLPQLFGVGYPVIENAIQGEYAILFLLLLLAGKIVATSVTIGIGGSGGVFAPSLYMGAMLGAGYGALVHLAFPGFTAPAGAYGIVGMGAVFAAAARAPITSAIIVFELTDEYSIMLPVLLAVVVATSVSSRLTRDSIYTLKLRRRGIDVVRGRAANLMQLIAVKDAMQPVPAPLPAHLSLAEAMQRLSAGGLDALPVVDEAGHYRGAVTARSLEDAARENALDVPVANLALELPAARANDTLDGALSALVRHEVTGVPVLAADGKSVTGWLTHRDVLRAYHERLAEGVSRVEGAHPPDAAGAAGTTTPLERLRGYRIVELEIEREGFPVGHPLSEIRLPPSALVLFLRRGGESLDPKPDTVLQKHDGVVVLVREEAADTVAHALEPPP